MPPKPSTRLYLMGAKHRQHRYEEEGEVRELPADLREPERREPIKPLKRELESLDEVLALYQQVLDANASWMADTIENKRRVCELFTSDDERISHRLDLNDMVTAATILSAYLDRVPPPPKPTFPDDDLSQPLPDGSMPLPLDATEYEQRKGTLPQVRNLVDRLRRFEAWMREQQQQEPQ